MFLYCAHRLGYVRHPSAAIALHGQARLTFVCQNCGAVYGRWQGKCDACGEWNTIAEEGAARRPRRCPGRAPRKGRVFALEPLAGETHEAPRLPSGIAELDRVTGGGFVRGSVLLIGGDPGIGKSTLLIQAAAALARSRPPRGLYLGRGGGRAGAAARRAARPRRRAGRARGRDLGRGHHRDAVARARRRASSSSIRSRPCGPTRSNRAPGTVTQVRGVGAGADPLRQALRRRRDPGRPRHQGRPDRRPARGRAHGRRGALLRGRRRAPVPHPARGEEPLRPDRRDRRVRDDRRGLARGRRTRPSCSSSERDLGSARHRGVRRHRGHAAAAGRNPGAGRADLARHAAPRRGRLGPEPALHGARRAGSALRRASSAATTSISTSPAACASRSRPPISRPRPRSSPRSPVRRCRRMRSISARSRCPARSGRWRRARRGCKEAAKLGFARAVVPEAARGEAGDAIAAWRVDGAYRLAGRPRRPSIAAERPDGRARTTAAIAYRPRQDGMTPARSGAALYTGRRAARLPDSERARAALATVRPRRRRSRCRSRCSISSCSS